MILFLDFDGVMHPFNCGACGTLTVVNRRSHFAIHFRKKRIFSAARSCGFCP